MKNFPANRRTRWDQSLRWALLCLVLTWTVGCQSLIKSRKGKEALTQDKFSCGEHMPPRVP